jgi:hypothetical protein
MKEGGAARFVKAEPLGAIIPPPVRGNHTMYLPRKPRMTHAVPWTSRNGIKKKYTSKYNQEEPSPRRFNFREAQCPRLCSSGIIVTYLTMTGGFTRRAATACPAS